MQASDLIRKVRKIDIITARKVAESLAGSYHSVFKGRGVEFAEVRPYQPGDDVRFIDWNVTARTGDLHTKNFTEERELLVNLVVDVSASLQAGSGSSKREAVAETCALLAYSAIANGDRAGLILFSDRIEKVLPPRKGRRHGLRIIRELLAHEPRGQGTDLALALNTLNRLSKRSVTFFVSDFLHGFAGFERAVAMAARKHDLIPVVLRDRSERVLPTVGLVRLLDAESRQAVWVDAASVGVRERFRLSAARQEDEVRGMFRKARVVPVQIENGDDAVTPFVRYFAQRHVRR